MDGKQYDRFLGNSFRKNQDPYEGFQSIVYYLLFRMWYAFRQNLFSKYLCIDKNWPKLALFLLNSIQYGYVCNVIYLFLLFQYQFSCHTTIAPILFLIFLFFSFIHLSIITQGSLGFIVHSLFPQNTRYNESKTKKMTLKPKKIELKEFAHTHNKFLSNHSLFN